MKQVLFRRWLLAGIVLLLALAPLTAVRAQGENSPETTWNPTTNTVSFLRGSFPTQAGGGFGLQASLTPHEVALAFLEQNAARFGISDPNSELVLVSEERDEAGRSHLTYQQVYQGVAVYGALVKVHIAADGGSVVAASSGFVPGIALDSVAPLLTGEQAQESAQLILPGGQMVDGPRLVVYLAEREAPAVSARLAWLAEVRDLSVPARARLAFDAQSGALLERVELLKHERGVAALTTYTANNTDKLPGELLRVNDGPASGDADADKAHDFARQTYDYFFGNFRRDSFDNQGAVIISSVHYGKDYQNAFWDGTQMVYGDDMVALDVVAHELTHAITERTANLEYRWQSGAINESLSDIFGAMVDREDWLMGEDLPATILGDQYAIRDMAHPSRFGMPGHTENWVATCLDDEAVHYNSGIPNRAYVLIAGQIGKTRTERIFFHSLLYYLTPTSSMEDLRAAVLQSTEDLYGADELAAVKYGFDTVGLDGKWNPPVNQCDCPATASLSGDDPQANAADLGVLGTLYQVRDEVMPGTPAGDHYRELYEQHGARIVALFALDPALRAEGAGLLRAAAPGLASLDEGQPDVTVSQELVDGVQAFLDKLSAADRAAPGGGGLADTIAAEQAAIDWDGLVGLTFKAAFAVLNEK